MPEPLPRTLAEEDGFLGNGFTPVREARLLVQLLDPTLSEAFCCTTPLRGPPGGGGGFFAAPTRLLVLVFDAAKAASAAAAVATDDRAFASRLAIWR